MSDWGQGAKNNNIGWGQGSVNNNISWGSVHANSWAGDTNIVGFAFDSDYQAILDRANELGYTLPTLEQQNLQNTLLINMKADGVWSKLDVFYNFANNGGRDFARINWKNPNSTVATLFNSITFNSNIGYQGNGTDMYIDTNFQLASGTNYTQNNASRYLWLNTASGTSVFDGNSAAASNTIRRASSTAQRINQSVTGVAPAFDFTATAGMKSIHRTSATSITLFNGTVSDTRTVASLALTATNHFILRSQTTYGAHTISMYAVGASLVSENTNFVNDYQSYLNSI